MSSGQKFYISGSMQAIDFVHIYRLGNVCANNWNKISKKLGKAEFFVGGQKISLFEN